MENIKIALEILVGSLQPISSSSSSSDSSEGEETDEDEMPREKRVRITDYVDNTVHAYSDVSFREHFRMSRGCVEYLISQYGQNIAKRYKGGWPEISVEKEVLVTLWYLANNETFRQISDRFDISNSSAHDVLKRYVTFLTQQAVLHIKWPTERQAKKIAQAFACKHKFPNIIGAIDGTHIHIKKPPGGTSNDYINRKSYSSILLQGVVDNRKLFIDICVGYPGSLHDARLLRKSKLFEKVTNGENLFYNRYYLLGDSAYPALNWLVPPFKDNGLLTAQQTAFNYRHSATRIVVEHAYGLLKGRFRRLFYFANESVPFITNLTLAACVLHNICIIQSDYGEDLTMDVQDDVDNDVEIIEQGEENVNRREQIFQQLFPS